MSEKVAKWAEEEQRTCETCGSDFTCLAIQWVNECDSCCKVRAEERWARLTAHAAERGYTIESAGGACPYQAEGLAMDGRPYYFRARHGEWTLNLGEPGGEPPYGRAEGLLLAEGDDPANGSPEDDFVLAILDEHLSA